MIAGAVSLAALASAATAETVRLRFHTFYGTEIDPIADKFKDAVKEASDGSLRIQYFRGGELVASDQFADAVSKGTLDIVHGHGGYWSGQVDIGNIEAGLPGAWTSVEEAKAIFESEEVNSLLTEADSAELTVAAQTVWQEEAERSPRNKAFIDALVANAKAQGRLK